MKSVTDNDAIQQQKEGRLLLSNVESADFCLFCYDKLSVSPADCTRQESPLYRQTDVTGGMVGPIAIIRTAAELPFEIPLFHAVEATRLSADRRLGVAFATIRPYPGRHCKISRRQR